MDGINPGSYIIGGWSSVTVEVLPLCSFLFFSPSLSCLFDLFICLLFHRIDWNT
ncbi:uncharacterized protein BDW47DRAFT_100577 [Aspergillus candidus]|uniref:Uncharacterized protein n=1 Tax=Aspergillus candidus TaxID=41067 RepID=A0A2I2FKK3_ASPCN|nr:hypothetical protein BDW47DRAFT_100577 [Aspergillus candidus]PLB41151.1 hypothetical protein BDW47DRAFT_100577 [Aspergillus candidus]